MIEKQEVKYKSISSHLKKLTNQEYHLLRTMSRASKSLYNSTLYETKQHYEQTNQFLRYEKAYHIVKSNPNKFLLPSQTAQQTMKMVERAMRSFFHILKEKKKGRYNRPANPPKYLKKDGYFVLIFPKDHLTINYSKNEIGLTIPRKLKPQFQMKRLYLPLPKCLTKEDKIKEVRINPSKNAWWFNMEIIYEDERKYEQIEDGNEDFLSIDLGVSNLATCYDDKNNKSFIIDGKNIKSYNRYFNKEIGKLQSIAKIINGKYSTKKISKLFKKRGNQLKNDFHLISKRIVDYCLKNKIGNIVIGYNKEWKQNVEIGKTNNQNFVQIPYRMLIHNLEYKGKDHNIKVHFTNEAYTSKADALSCEEIKKKEDFVGKRIFRGLFKSGNGKTINADLNGAINILRKHFDKCKTEFKGFNKVPKIGNSGAVIVPKRIRVDDFIVGQSSFEEKL